MPTYDYKCNECKTEFELFRLMTDESPVPCGSCQSTDTTKLVTGVPHVAIAWRNTIGLGSSGQRALTSVTNKVRKSFRRQRARAKQVKHLKLEEA